MDSSSSFDQQLVRESLECPVCKDFYVEPKQLACGHTFCQECIERLEKVPSFNGWSDDISALIDASAYIRAFDPRRRPNARNRISGFSIMCPNCREMSQIPEAGLNTNYVVKEMVEKFRDVQVTSNANLAANAKEEERTLCFSCPRRIPSNELFLCKDCHSSSINSIPNINPFICAFCVVTIHKEHKIVSHAEIASMRDRDEAASTIIEMGGQAHSHLKQMKQIQSELAHWIEELQKKFQSDIEVFEILHLECYDSDSYPLKENLEQNVRNAKQMAERFFKAHYELDKFKHDLDQYLRSFYSKSNNNTEQMKRARLQCFVDPTAPSTSEQQMYDAWGPSTFRRDEVEEMRRILTSHRRKKRNPNNNKNTAVHFFPNLSSSSNGRSGNNEDDNNDDMAVILE